VSQKNIAIVLIALALGACNREPYRVGVWQGPTGANLAKMAEQEINFNGGVAGRRLNARVVSMRDVSQNLLTPEILRASLDSIARDTMVLAVITRMTDSVTEAAAQQFEEVGVPYLVSTPVDENYVKTHPHAFLLVPTIQEQAEFLAQQAVAEPSPRTVAIMHVREPHAETLANAIKTALAARGIAVAFTSTFAQSADEINITAKAREMAAQKPSILYWIGRSPSLLLVHPIVRNAVPNVRFLSSDLTESWHLYTNPQGVFTGVRFVRYMDPSSADSLVKGLRERLLMWIGRNELNNEVALTYDAIRAVAQVIRAGNTSRAAVLQYLRSNPTLTAVNGPMRFADQRVARPMELAEVMLDTVLTVTTTAARHASRN
jgi:ABC-type branched-subunit amino acid transport system substrate-binding protein